MTIEPIQADEHGEEAYLRDPTIQNDGRRCSMEPLRRTHVITSNAGRSFPRKAANLPFVGLVTVGSYLYSKNCLLRYPVWLSLLLGRSAILPLNAEVFSVS